MEVIDGRTRVDVDRQGHMAGEHPITDALHTTRPQDPQSVSDKRRVPLDM